MAYLNFSDALMESKRRARLQGREVSQQEAAGISEGIGGAAAEKSVQVEQLAQNKEQFNKSLGQREVEFSESVGQNKKQYELAVQTLAAQISQYEQSSATQREQFGEQMKFQIGESARLAKEFKEKLDAAEGEFTAGLGENKRQFGITAGNAQSNFEKNYNFALATTGAQMNQAGIALPSSVFAPEGWNPAKYLENNVDVAGSEFYSRNPLNHWYLLGKGEGRKFD